jgi:hypothetical protein
MCAKVLEGPASSSRAVPHAERSKALLEPLLRATSPGSSPCSEPHVARKGVQRSCLKKLCSATLSSVTHHSIAQYTVHRYARVNASTDTYLGGGNPTLIRCPWVRWH